MAVVEYMLHRVDGSNRRDVPGFIGDRGYWMSPFDSSFIGWVDDTTDYYVPDTIVRLTKQQLIDRQLLIHATYPMVEPVAPGVGEPGTQGRTLSNEEVTAMISDWYDDFVARNS